MENTNIMYVKRRMGCAYCADTKYSVDEKGNRTLMCIRSGGAPSISTCPCRKELMPYKSYMEYLRRNYPSDNF